MQDKPQTIDAYIAPFPPEVSTILETIRTVVHQRVPDAVETLSYAMPAFRNGRVFFYFAAFKSHIGIYPPLSADHPLRGKLAPYANPKGNLKFPLKDPIPYDLIGDLAEALATQYGQGD